MLVACCGDIWDEFIAQIEDVMEDYELEKHEVRWLIFSSSGTRMPKIASIALDYF